MFAWCASICTVGLNFEAASFATYELVISCTIVEMNIANQCLGLLNVLLTKQKLAIEVAEIDRVQINNVDLTKTCKNEIL